ncbi:MAG: hypothetical protein F4Z15_09225 [Gammaproteobacteria bacterium]|nr:hypothetical protein [Gammaproteobacteria bacterium]MYD77316.1 hypothetical protein [Gammaproteobacteria bacterium]
MRTPFFEPYQPDKCCLCGSPYRLTGEHKIKASALKDQFSNEGMVIGEFSHSPTYRGRYLQSAKSKALQFSARICATCNNSRTQPADREFDSFRSLINHLVKAGEDPHLVFDNDRYIEGSMSYLNVFRYFAKLLCCHLAEVKGPRPVHMAEFAIGKNDENCICLKIDYDWTYQQFQSSLGQRPYAAHGGLVVYADNREYGPNAFHSTLTIGAVQYVFYSRLTWLERLTLKNNHRNFYNWCRDRAIDATVTPVSMTERLMLGIESDE